MFSLCGLDHVVLRVRHPERAIAFYCDVLGCKVERKLPIGLVQLRAGSSLIDLVPVESELGRQGGEAPGMTGHNMDHFCLQVDPFDGVAIQRHLAHHGVEAGEITQRYGANGFGASIYITDPEGNVVELKGSSDPLTLQEVTST